MRKGKAETEIESRIKKNISIFPENWMSQNDKTSKPYTIQNKYDFFLCWSRIPCIYYDTVDYHFTIDTIF